jgi:hypothetical protein
MNKSELEGLYLYDWYVLMYTLHHLYICTHNEWYKFGRKKTPMVKNIERKNIDSTMNAASVYFFANTASIMCSSIHIFHLYVNSVCWRCINDTFDIFSFYQIYTHSHNVMRKRRTIIISESFNMHITAPLSYLSFLFISNVDTLLQIYQLIFFNLI